MNLLNTLLTRFKANKMRYGNIKNQPIQLQIQLALHTPLKQIKNNLYKATFKNQDILLIVGETPDLSDFETESFDCVITDKTRSIRPNKQSYSQQDFAKKERILKDDGFILEFLPKSNATNYNFMTQLNFIAKRSGLKYYGQHKQQNHETLMIFCKNKSITKSPTTTQSNITTMPFQFLKTTQERLIAAFKTKPLKSI